MVDIEGNNLQLFPAEPCRFVLSNREPFVVFSSICDAEHIVIHRFQRPYGWYACFAYVFPGWGGWASLLRWWQASTSSGAGASSKVIDVFCPFEVFVALPLFVGGLQFWMNRGCSFLFDCALPQLSSVRMAFCFTLLYPLSCQGEVFSDV